ncbi:MAG: hypothetical protein GY841_10090 [FCB group bacterium]|nr:hypothetical protein [FCB group bacterium]
MAIIVLLPTVPVWADSGSTVELEGNPAEVHRWLWENKLQPSLGQKQATALSLDAQTAANWQEYDVYFYSIDLTVYHLSATISGRVGIYGRATVDGLDTVKVNLSDSLTIDSVYNSSGNLTFTHGGNYLTVNLDASVNTGEGFDFTVVYSGHPESSGSFAGFRFTSNGGLHLITTLSEPMGARSWWPCNDITTDKADSVDIIVTVDASLVVASNGLLESDIDNGDGTHTVYWKERYPIVTYLVSLAIHPYAVWYDWYHYSPTDSMPLEFYVYPSHDAYSRPFFGVLPEMIGIMADVFGEYPFIDEKYGCSHFDWGGAMEHQTLTSTTSSSFGYSDDVVAHELGHQWWGDMITCGDWHHIWINEGFAVYSEALYHEAKYGTNYYHTYMNAFEYTGGGSIYIHDTTDVWNIFGAIVYDKGGWVLHMLRHVVGDADFFQSLADYRAQYQWKTATTEEFQAVVETVSGMDLEWFFEQWIYGTFRPIYRHSYLAEENPAGGWNLYLHVRQLQATSPTFFTMPIDIRFETLSGPHTEMVFNDRQNQNFVIATDYEASGITLDPNRWITRTESSEFYTIHILTESLSDGVQYEYYHDTVVAKSGQGSFFCRISDGALPDGWELDSATCIISGMTSDSGSYAFTVEVMDENNSSYSDTASYAIEVAGSVAIPGDANFDGGVDVGDAVYLINFIFKNGPDPQILDWADANADCALNVGDCVYLINFVFKNGDPPVLGCM